MVERYCLYCITFIIILLYINMCCSSSKLQDTNQDEDLPLSTQILNKYFSENSEDSGSTKIIPAMLRQGANENILEVLNNEEVKKFLQKLPLSILKQLNIIFSMDEYNGYCYLIKLFKYYNKNWTKEIMPLENCVVKEDDEIFGHYVFDSQKLDNELEKEDSSYQFKILEDKKGEQSKISDSIYYNNIQKFTSTTTAKPIRYFETSSKSGQKKSQTHENKFKLYLKNKTMHFKPSPFENGSFNPSFSPPLSRPKQFYTPDVILQSPPIPDDYKLLLDSKQMMLSPKQRYPWNWPPLTTSGSAAVPEVKILRDNRKEKEHGVSALTLLQNYQGGNVQGTNDLYSDTDKNQNENRYLSSNSNSHSSVQSLFDDIQPQAPTFHGSHGVPHSHGVPYTEVSIPTMSSHISHSAPAPLPSYYLSHAHYIPHHVHPPAPAPAPVYINSHAPTAHVDHVHHSVKSWIGNIFHHGGGTGSGYGHGPSKTILDLSISILPFLAFGSYIVLLLLQALNPRIFPTVFNTNRNGTSIFPLLRPAALGRGFFDISEDTTFLKEGTAYINELDSKIRSILLSNNLGNDDGVLS